MTPPSDATQAPIGLRYTKECGVTLIFDADDTLWHNNIHFERAIEEFLDFLDHSTLSRAEVRAVLNEIEHATSTVHGYGAAAFTYSLQACYARLAERDIDEASLRRVIAFGERILSADIELIDGVQETLDILASRHHLTLFTKGHPEEQRLKIERSGLADRFLHHEIVPEKRLDAYLDLGRRLGAPTDRIWMVGNSPKSDINPALAAGWNAVFIPHEHTWVLEHQDLEQGGERLLILNRFPELLNHF